MAALYVVSMGEAAGKSAFIAGLGRKFQAAGKKAGYLKPVCGRTGESDRDAAAMKQLLALEEPVASLCAVSGGIADMAATLDEQEPAWLKKIKNTYAAVSQGKDVVLLEGAGGFEAGGDMARIEGRIADALKAKVILIVPFSDGIGSDAVVAAANVLADNLIGVVVNKVPERRMELIRTRIVPALEQSGIRVLGVLPEDRALFGVTVGELAEHVGGSILNAQDRTDEVVESLMVGAMSMDSALSYLSLKPNKAVITRGDRPDIQLAALETSTKCLVLTSNGEPVATIMNRAGELEVPIVMVAGDTVSTMEALETVFDKAVFSSEKKVEKLGQLLDANIDMDAVYRAA